MLKNKVQHEIWDATFNGSNVSGLHFLKIELHKFI